jgi:hypothetical protein
LIVKCPRFAKREGEDQPNILQLPNSCNSCNS